MIPHLKDTKEAGDFDIDTHAVQELCLAAQP